MIEVDVTLVASRRPELLELTLQSFHENLLRDLRVRRLIVNIDPIWGTREDADRVLDLCQSYGWDVVSRRPETPSFCGAVQWVWSQTSTDWFLHLEDDWCLARRINVDRLYRTMQSDDVGQIAFDHVEKKARKWKRGLTLRSFTTSPSFVRGDLGRTVSQHFVVEKDPEKQLSSLLTSIYSDRSRPYRAVLYGNRLTPFFLFDTGRTWRAERGIEKKISQGISTWTISQPGAGLQKPCLDAFRRRMQYTRYLPKI